MGDFVHSESGKIDLQRSWRYNCNIKIRIPQMKFKSMENRRN